jgi:prephenate dehydrogenase
LVAATALFSLASESLGWQEIAGLTGPGFRDTTRLASTSPDLSHDICLTNRQNLVHWLGRYIEELRRFRSLIADDQQQEALITAFAKVQAARDAFLDSPPARPGPSSDVEMASTSERMMSFMLGEYVVRRSKEIQETIERHERGDGPGQRKR